MKKISTIIATAVLGCNFVFAGNINEQAIDKFFNVNTTLNSQNEMLYQNMTGRNYAADLNTRYTQSKEYFMCMSVANNLYDYTILPMALLVSENEQKFQNLYGEEQYNHIYKTIGGFLTIYKMAIVETGCKHAPVNTIASLTSNQSRLLSYWTPSNAISPIR